MASKYASYTRLRDIASKRIKRLEESGLSVGFTFPTVKQIKTQNINLNEATARLQLFIESPTKVREYKKLPEIERVQVEKYVKKEREREQHRQRNRRYRERERNLTKRESADLKASRKLGYSVGPSQAAIFSEYLAYRFKYGNENLRYAILNYTEDYKAITKKKKYMTFDEMQKDFEQYVLDRKSMQLDYENMEGISGKQFESMWQEYSGVESYSRRKRTTKWYKPKHRKNK